MNRAMAYLAALAAVGGAVYLAGTTRAQAPAAAAPAKAGGKVAVFNVVKVTREYHKWQHLVKQMGEKRMAEDQAVAKAQAELAALQDQAQREAVKAKQEELGRQFVDKKRALEDRQRQVGKALNDETAGHLKQLHGEIQKWVKAIAETYGYDLVLAYPDAVTPDQAETPQYFDLKLRPEAAMPFYVSPAANVDITDVLIATLNKYSPPDGVKPAGGAAAAGR